MAGPILQLGEPGFPDWAEGYWAVRELDDGRWLTWGPLFGVGRSRINHATERGTEGEFW